jgi:cell division protein FtsN
VRRALPHLAALLCGVAAALVVGCGDRSHLIPQTRADGLKSTLSSVQQAVDAGDCAAAAAGVRQLRAQVEHLPTSVDKRLKSNLRQGVRQLKSNFEDDCANAQQQTVDTTTTETQTVETETTPTETTTTPTVTTPTDTTTTPTTTPTTPTTTPTQPTATSTTPNGGTEGAPSP